MTSYDVEIAVAVWEKAGGDKKEGCLFASLPNSSTMPAQRFFNRLSTRPRWTIDSLQLLTHSSYRTNTGLDDCLLRTVHIYKRKYGAQHESVMFTLQSGTTQFRILVDRALDLIPPCFFSSGSFADGSWKPAVDYARAIQTEEPPRSYGDVVRMMALPPDPPSQFRLNLLQLATLLFTIGETNDGPKYHLTKMNCFWYARTVRRAILYLAAEAQAEVTEPIHGNEDRMGKCFGIRLDGSGPQGDVDPLDDIRLGALIDRYRQEYDDILSGEASHGYLMVVMPAYH
jgi:hypothetical protein